MGEMAVKSLVVLCLFISCVSLSKLSAYTFNLFSRFRTRYKMIFLLATSQLGILPVSARKIDQRKLKITQIPTSLDGRLWKNTFWDKETQRVFAADVYGSQLMSYSYADKQMHLVEVEGTNGSAIFFPVANSSDQFLVSTENEGFLVQWDGQSETVQKGATVFELESGTNVDSIAVGPHGNIYASNLGPQICVEQPRFGVFGLEASGDLATYADDFYETSGAVLIPDQRIYYHLEACRKQLHAFTWDPQTDELTDKRLVMQFDYSTAAPIGLAADVNGFLYSGLYNGSSVLKIDPTIPAVVDQIDLPTPLVAIPVFGGPNNDILFITTGTLIWNPATNVVEKIFQDGIAGSLFQIEGLGAKGIPAHRPFLG